MTKHHHYHSHDYDDNENYDDDNDGNYDDYDYVADTQFCSSQERDQREWELEVGNIIIFDLLNKQLIVNQ